VFTRFVRRFSHAVQIKGQDKFRTRKPHKGVQDKNEEAKSKAKNNFENEHPTRGDKKENGEAKSKAKKKFEHENLTRGYKKKTGRPNQRPRKFSNMKTSQGGTRKKTRRPNQRLRKNSSTKTSQGGDKAKSKAKNKFEHANLTRGYKKKTARPKSAGGVARWHTLPRLLLRCLIGKSSPSLQSKSLSEAAHGEMERRGLPTLSAGRRAKKVVTGPNSQRNRPRSLDQPQSIPPIQRTRFVRR